MILLKLSFNASYKLLNWLISSKPFAFSIAHWIIAVSKSDVGVSALNSISLIGFPSIPPAKSNLEYKCQWTSFSQRFFDYFY